MLYNEHAFIDRFAAAAKDGFCAVEYLFPYAFDPRLLRAQLEAHQLEQVLFNAPPGHWDAGERGIACLPGREAEFREGFKQALEYAAALDCPQIHVMAGLDPQDIAWLHLNDTYLSNLLWACEQAAQDHRDVLIEPINTRDMPGYFLNRQDIAHQIVQDLAQPNLKVQMDLYHCQIVEGDLAAKIQQYLPTGRVGHFQIAGVPLRHEPDVGEVNYSYLFELIDTVAAQCGWKGWIGCEYKPALGAAPGSTSAGLGWLKNQLRGIS